MQYQCSFFECISQGFVLRRIKLLLDGISKHQRSIKMVGYPGQGPIAIAPCKSLDPTLAIGSTVKDENFHSQPVKMIETTTARLDDMQEHFEKEMRNVQVTSPEVKNNARGEATASEETSISQCNKIKTNLC